MDGLSAVTIEQMAEFIIRGGWPEGAGKPLADARKTVESYCESITSLNRLGGMTVDSGIVRQLMRSLSRNNATSVSDTDLIQDISMNEGESMHINTLRRYESIFCDCFITDDLRAWRPKTCSKAVPRASDKRHLCDPSIAACFLRMSPDDLVGDLRTYGSLFESLAVRDLT